MGKIKLDIKEIQKFTQKVRGTYSQVSFSSINEFEQSSLNKLIVKQIMGAVALGQSEIALRFPKMRNKTQYIIQRYFESLGFQVAFINVVNENKVVIDGILNSEGDSKIQNEILKEIVGEENLDSLTDMDKEQFFNDVGKLFKIITSDIPEKEETIELRICWDGAFYKLNQKFNGMSRIINNEDDEDIDKLQEEIEGLLNLFGNFDLDDDEDNDEEF